ncbi:MAG: DEAD/DEAH box helicase [Aerococcaceae bacterium]|nr:DEAD/DEAH box helicase [Aerococcaceae bacterium]
MQTNLPTALQSHWIQKGFTTPTDIQQQIYQPLLNGASFVAISPTGTGKTLAYLLPLLSRLEANQELQAIIVAPSQELAKQIGVVAQEWAATCQLNVQLIVGGANFKRQQEALKNKPELIVATPGRFNELLDKTRKLKVHTVKTVIFDEADYLFEQENRRAVEQMQRRFMRDTQYVWLSATFGEDLRTLAKEQQLQVYEVSRHHQNTSVAHYYIVTPNRQKVAQLKRLAQLEAMRAIVFFEQVNELEETAAKLLYQGIRAVSLHGQLSKQERELAIRLFTKGEATYLLTTDMAARGLDIEDVAYVVHFNRVADARTYIHRSGRTGRMGKKGTVLSLVNEQEGRDLAQILQPEAIQLSERLIHSAQLIEPSDKPISDRPQKPAVKSKRVAAPTPTQTTTTKTKKKRTRDTKNKGKRKKQD